MTDVERQQARLRTQSDDLLADLQLLHGLEEEKRTLPPDSPRFQELAAQVEQLAGRVLEASGAQRSLGKEMAEGSPEAGKTPIEESPVRPVPEILADWREAERRATSEPAGSLEQAMARADAARLRDEYRVATRQVEMR